MDTKFTATYGRYQRAMLTFASRCGLTRPSDAVQLASMRMLQDPGARDGDSDCMRRNFWRKLRDIIGEHRRRRGRERTRRGIDRVSALADPKHGHGHADRDACLAQSLEEYRESAQDRELEILERHYGKGTTVAECADAVGCSTSTVERALLHFRRWLSKETGMRMPSRSIRGCA